MALVMNCLNKENSTKAHGNWFTFKPKQIKQMGEDIANFIAQERLEEGFVKLPETFEDLDYRSSEEGKAELAMHIQRGVDGYIRGLRRLVYNEQVSLAQDLAKADMKFNPALLGSESYEKALEELLEYQTAKDDADQKKIDKIKKLADKVGPISKV